MLDDLRKGFLSAFTKNRVWAGWLLASLTSGMMTGAAVVYWILGGGDEE